jgi:hypothetical protein
MARRPRASRLETRTARLKLRLRQKPYDFTTISPGIALGYRRNRAAGTWVLRAADGHGGNWTKRVALADGANVLTWWQAIEAARKLARGTDADVNRPASFADATDAYERDLIARGGNVANAQRIRKHITATLASKPVGLLTTRELTHWRDGLLAAGMKPATAVRLFKNAKAALSLAARRDHRITNQAAWRDGLSGLAENSRAAIHRDCPTPKYRRSSPRRMRSILPSAATSRLPPSQARGRRRLRGFWSAICCQTAMVPGS